MAGGRHHVDPVACLQALAGEGREDTASLLLDGDPEVTLADARANGVRAPYFDAIDGHFESDMLAVGEAVGLAQFCGYRERERDGVGRLAFDVGYLESMKLRRA